MPKIENIKQISTNIMLQAGAHHNVHQHTLSVYYYIFIYIHKSKFEQAVDITI